MAHQHAAVCIVVVMALTASTVGARTLSSTDVPGSLSPKAAWKSCHDTVMAKFHAAKHWEMQTLPKGLRPYQEDTHVAATDNGSQEGIACSWEEVLPGLEMCTTNWKQLNKTLVPGNDVSRASANVYAKAYVCGMNDADDTCAAVDHCRWNDQWELCSLSSFYFTLQFSCKDSPVRQVSVCIDHPADACAADSRCTWHSFASDPGLDVCLPSSVPTSWPANQVFEWLLDLFNDDSKFFTNWGDCPTSHSWQELTSCGKRTSEDGCGEDDACIWLAPFSICSLKPEKMVEVLWGGDMKTVNAITGRESYCHRQRNADMCLRAMPNRATSRL